MAGIDKIYGSVDQYKEFRLWCETHNKELLKWFYPLNESCEGNQCITNFPTKQDKWLKHNCTLVWVIDALKEQYSKSFDKL